MSSPIYSVCLWQVCMQACMPWHICGGQRTSCPVWVLGIELKSSGLVESSLPAELCCQFITLLRWQGLPWPEWKAQGLPRIQPSPGPSQLLVGLPCMHAAWSCRLQVELQFNANSAGCHIPSRECRWRPLSG